MGLFGGGGGSAASNLQTSSTLIFTPTLQLSSPSAVASPGISPSLGSQSASQTQIPVESNTLLPGGGLGGLGGLFPGTSGGGGFPDLPGSLLHSLDAAGSLDTPRAADRVPLGEASIFGAIPVWGWIALAGAAYLAYGRG